MTDEKYVNATNLKHKIGHIEELIKFSKQQNRKFYLGEPDPDLGEEDVITLDGSFILPPEVKREYDIIRERAKEEFIKFLEDKLNDLKVEFSFI